MVNANAKYQQHVNEGRFPQGTDPTIRSICGGCHSKATVFEDVWRAPANADFSRLSIPEACNHMAGSGTFGKGRDVLNHLLVDPLIVWAIPRIPGMTLSEWESRVRAWVGQRTLNEGPLCPPRD